MSVEEKDGGNWVRFLLSIHPLYLHLRPSLFLEMHPVSPVLFYDHTPSGDKINLQRDRLNE